MHTGNQKRIYLSEGEILLRALSPAETEDLHRIEAENQAEPATALARYMPLIAAVTVRTATWNDAKIPADQTPLDYLLGLEPGDGKSMWGIVRALYELGGLTLPAGVPLA